MSLSKENQEKLEILSSKYQGRISKDEIKEAALNYFQEHATLSGFDIETLIKNKEKNPSNKEQAANTAPEKTENNDKKEDSLLVNEDGKGRSPHPGFKLNFDKNPRATNLADGNMFDAENPYELFNKLNDELVKRGSKGGTLVLGEKNKNREDIKEACARSCIEHGLKMEGDYPQTPEFWQSFKAEYLKDKKHSAENWEKLTAHIPDEIMGREKFSDKEKLNMLSKQGINPNLEPPKKQNTVQTKLNISQLPSKQQSIGS